MSQPPAGDGTPRTPTPRPSAARRAAQTRRQNRARQLSLILARSAREARSIGMSPTALVQAMLPHQEVYQRGPDGRPVEVPDGHGGTTRLKATHYSARNGDYRLTVAAGLQTGPSHLHPLVSRGVPYGGLARLLLAFVVTRAKLEDTRTIDLGRTLTAFCQTLGVTPSGGDHGRLPYLIDQVQRLATCSITWQWDEYGPGRRDLEGENMFVVQHYRFYHQDGSETREPIDGGSITLSQAFWDHAVADVFPIDWRKAQLFRAWPMAYDLYLWLTYRLERLRRSGKAKVVLNYDHLHAQLGSHYQTDERGALTPDGKKNFARKVRLALRAVAATWPALRYETPRGRVVLYNTGPDVEYRPSTSGA